jgi:hypothetical protein
MRPFSTIIRFVGGIQLLFAGVCILMPSVLSAESGVVNLSKRSSSVSHTGTVGVDTSLIRKLYMDGDFDQAVAILESDLKSQKMLSHVDSVFIFKHLGVMYAARYETRERGKMYMHQLLMTEPTAKIMDMYASDMIYMIFKNIQDEFETNRARFDQAREHAKGSEQTVPQNQSVAKPDSAESGSHRHLGLWIGAGALVAGIGGYFLFLSFSNPGAQNHSF